MVDRYGLAIALEADEVLAADDSLNELGVHGERDESQFEGVRGFFSCATLLEIRFLEVFRR